MNNDKRPLILISNDDGYHYNGIKSLIDVAKQFGDIFVAAPAVHQSGKSSAITFVNPVRTFLVKQELGLTVYLATGTPADCVKLAIVPLYSELMPML